MEAARENNGLGRPKKFDEDTSQLTVRLPESVRDYLESLNPIVTDAVIGLARFDKALSEHLEDIRSDLIMSAAGQAQEFSKARAENIARLVKLGLQCEKQKTKK